MKFAPIVLAALAMACSKAPTLIDGSSAETFAQTIEEARRDLPIKDRLTFDAALHNPVGRRFSAGDLDEAIRQSYHGMTAAQVVADARARGIG
ncbi:hypothetical protein [Sphingomonas xanthus]|uniref:Lipoprotein n=1 Tax=Sphingomonas xanthus TaxID=2594473 RepID=A0A516IQ03_9SPHN|nr:hypothetical protein [Sphingomonas xanthus]QDP18959.1 hypothetical protein FMM02_02665 [Sphingomonas xanthus]